MDINVIAGILILVLLLGVGAYFAQQLPMEENFRKLFIRLCWIICVVILIVVILIVVFWLLAMVGISPRLPGGKVG